MSDKRLAQLHDNWVYDRQASTQDVGEMLDEIDRLKEVVKKLEEVSE